MQNKSYRNSMNKDMSWQRLLNTWMKGLYLLSIDFLSQSMSFLQFMNSSRHFACSSFIPLKTSQASIKELSNSFIFVSVPWTCNKQTNKQTKLTRLTRTKCFISHCHLFTQQEAPGPKDHLSTIAISWTHACI